MAVSTAISPGMFTTSDWRMADELTTPQPIYRTAPLPRMPSAAIYMSDLNSDVFNLPLSRLCDLWVARYGNDWVPVSEVVKERFFELTYERLRSLGMLEMHYLTDRAHYVCRRPE